MLAEWNIDIKVGALPEKVATAFQKLNDLIGAKYSSIAYLGYQLVNGINHAVLAEQTILSEEKIKNIVLIIFNEKSNSLDDLTLVSIERVVEGGYGVGATVIDVETEINKTAQAVFDKAMSGFVETIVTPFALLATQMVRGTDFIYACEMSPVLTDNDKTDKTVAIAVINDIDEEIRFTDILFSDLEYLLTK